MGNRSKEEKNLVWIDKPAIDEKGNSNAFETGIATWNMYNEDFNLTIRDISNILKCERHWVLKNVKENVQHIFLNNEFRLFLNKLDRQNNSNTFNPGTFLKDYYYFSRKDFYRWLKENTQITRQTIQINIEEFAADPRKCKKLMDDYYSKEKELKEKGNCEKELLDLKNFFTWKDIL